MTGEHDPLPRAPQLTEPVGAEATGTRLDRFLADALAGLSRARLQALIRAGQVTLAGRTLGDPGYRVKPGERFAVLVPAPQPAEPRGEEMQLDIVHEDEALIVLDKPAGLVVHPAAGHATGTLVNALIAHCGDSLSGVGGVRRPGIVHRLDKDTSGLLVVAKTDAAHQGLSAQFAAHGRDGALHRAYLAVVWGVPAPQSGRIAAPIGRSRTHRTRMAVVPAAAGRAAATRYRVERTLPGGPAARTGPRQPASAIASLVRLELETGRTHQIRVHLSHIGHPLLGDPVYGGGFASKARNLSGPARSALAALGRQALHAAELGFVHPLSGRCLQFSSPLPADLQRLVDALG